MLFNEQVNTWMNGGKDASFNSTYRPYSDYEAKKREIIKTLTAEKVGTPVIYGPNGKLLSAMTYTEVEELSPQKILTALKQGLSPDEYQQLQIDGRYKYSNVSSEEFVSDVNSRFTIPNKGVILIYFITIDISLRFTPFSDYFFYKRKHLKSVFFTIFF